MGGGGRERGAGLRSRSGEGDGGSGSVSGVTGRRGEGRRRGAWSGGRGRGGEGALVEWRSGGWWRSGVVEAVPEKNGAVGVKAVWGGSGPCGGGPGGGGRGWWRSGGRGVWGGRRSVRERSGWGAVRVGAVQVGAVRVGAKISRFFLFPDPFFQFFEAFQVFSWTCVGGLGFLISKNCAKHTNLEFSVRSLQGSVPGQRSSASSHTTYDHCWYIYSWYGSYGYDHSWYDYDFWPWCSCCTSSRFSLKTGFN